MVCVSKKILISIFAIFGCFSLALGQDFIYDPDKKVKSDVEYYAEGEKKDKKKLLLIAYKPVMHLPDPGGDVELVMKSGKDLNGLHKRFRQALDMIMSEKFEEGFIVTSLLHANDSSKIDLHRVYGVANYNYEERPVEIEESKKLRNLGNARKKRPSKDVETRIHGGQISSRDIDRSRQYMNVSIPDSSFITHLSAKYDVDLLVFVNQFELKKSFGTGEDVAYGKYGREVIVHYSIFNKNGKQLYGNRAVDRIYEKQDHVNEIIAETFPDVSAEVYKHIPGANSALDAEQKDKLHEKDATHQDILRKD
ncbi:MAG: hypothetical protein JKY52_00930 [Flavobacteriales bacterium]|nr:hypothetical protein [Flavobacteriales bacterium]